MFTFTSLKLDQYERVNSLGVINLSKIKSTIKIKVIGHVLGGFCVHKRGPPILMLF